jgi:hypothetical protein
VTAHRRCSGAGWSFGYLLSSRTWANSWQLAHEFKCSDSNHYGKFKPKFNKTLDYLFFIHY